MAQFYTLDEAAARLGVPTDEFKRKLKTDAAFMAMRPFRDGPTLRFRAADVDELARSLGAASDPGLPLGTVGAGLNESAEDMIFNLTPEATPARGKPAPDDDEPLLIGDDADDDIFSAGRRTGPGSDSDVRLDAAPPARPYDPNENNPTEEISLDLAGPGSALIKPSGLSGRLSGGKSGGRLNPAESARIPAPDAAKPANKADDSSSEFELSVDPDNDSFEFQLTSDSSSEVDLTNLTPGGNKTGQSGINLAAPADSGVSLEGRSKGPKTGPLGKGAAAPDSDSDIDFELSLDPVRPGAKPKTGANLAGPASESEFELTLDSNSGVADAVAGSLQPADDAIFETDFELPSMDDDSGADLVSVGDESSEEFEVTADAGDDAVELDVDEGDAVMVVEDDEPVTQPAPRGRRSRGLDDALDDDLTGLDDGGYETRPAAAAIAAPPAAWGPLPAVVLMMTLPLVFLGALMGFEVIQGMLGYQSASTPGNALVRGVATSVLGETLAD